MLCSSITFDTSDHLREHPQIADILAQALSQLSVQVPILTSFLTLVHASMPDFSESVVHKTTQRLLKAVRDGDMASTRIILRSFACLASAETISMRSFIDLLKGLGEILISSNDTDAKDEAAFLLASTLIWTVDHSDNKEFLSFITPGLRAFVLQYVSPFEVNGKFSIVRGPLVWEQALHCLPGRESSGAFDNLQEIITLALSLLEGSPRPQSVTISFVDPTGSAPLSLSADSVKELIELFPSALGKKSREGALPTWLRLRLPILTTDAAEAINTAAQALSFNDRVVALIYMEDVLHFFDPIVLEDGTKLGSMELLMNHLLAIPKLFADVDSLSVLVMLVECLFHHVLQSGQSSAAAMQASRLILNLCKSRSGDIAPIVAHSANLAFQLLPDLQAVALFAYVQWFTFHYVNTKLSWPYWEFWFSLCEPPGEGEPESDGDEEVRAVLTFAIKTIARRLGHLLGHEKIKLRIGLPGVLFGDAHIDYSANCALYRADSEVAQCSLLAHEDARSWAQSIHILLHDRATADEVLNWFDHRAEKIDDPTAAALLLHAALFSVSEDQTVTAIVSILERYDTTLRALGESSAAQDALLQTLQDVYGHSPFMYSAVMNEMLRRSQLQVAPVARKLAAQITERDLLDDPEAIHCIENCMDRAIDFVRAAMAMASQQGIQLDLSAAKSMVSTQLDMQEEESEEKPEDFLHRAVGQAREVFHALLSACLVVLAGSSAGSAAKLLAASLLHRLFRVYVGAEKQLSQQFQQVVVISNRLQGSNIAVGADGQTFLSLLQQLQEVEPAAYRAWQGSL